jgi:type VI secretion system secreted protein VgrG
LTFTNIGVDDDFNPIGPGVQFTNPVGHLYAVYSYAQMEDDVQWTALWYRRGELVYFESVPWKGGSGGYDYTDWDPAPEEWLPGEYTVQIFLGTDFYITGSFTVVGDPPTPTATLTASPTLTFTPSPIPSATPSPTEEQ